jgi:hypothetical protein
MSAHTLHKCKHMDSLTSLFEHAVMHVSLMGLSRAR